MQHSFHGFDIQGKIGSGGMSTVYKGTHRTLGYSVAVKILHPGLAGDTNFIKRFEREAKAASALRSNNIASVIDFGSEDDVYFIVMEFIDGNDLAKIITQLRPDNGDPGAFPIEIALLLMEEVAYGLKEAHEHGLIHRDIKPANILIDQRGEVKIADFGLARDTTDLQRPGSLDLTVPGTVLGTPSYMSPEQAAGKADLDNRTDIFSLGVMAYQLITGYKPFTGDTPTAVQEKIINEEPAPLTVENCPLLTTEIETMIGKMLAKDPEKRYSTMDRLLRGIKEAMESVDRSGNLNRYRRDYLSSFAKEPVTFSDELRAKSISSHLKLGYHFKNQGLSNIDDALREFTYVLSIDPDNVKAAEALTELQRRQKEASGVTPPADGDVTQVMPGAVADPGVTMIMPGAGEAEADETEAAPEQATPKTAAPPPPPPPRAKADGPDRRLLFGGAGLVVVIALLWIIFGGGGGDTPADVESETIAEISSGEVSVAEATGGFTVETMPAGAAVFYRPAGSEEEFTQAAGTTPLAVEEVVVGGWQLRLELAGHDPVETTFDVESDGTFAGTWELLPSAPVAEAPAETPTAEVTVGRMHVTSSPPGARVQIKGPGQDRFESVGDTPWTSGDLEVGRWTVRVRLDGYGPEGLPVNVRPDVTRTFNFPLTPVTPPATGDGYMRLVISPFGDVYVDGKRQASETKVATVALESNRRHFVELKHGPTFSRIVLGDVEVAAGDTLRLPRQVFPWGALVISANAECEMMVDDRWQLPQRSWKLPRIGAGEHFVSARRAGLTVTGAMLLAGEERIELEAVNPNENPLRFRITIVEGREATVRFRLAQE